MHESDNEQLILCLVHQNLVDMDHLKIVLNLAATNNIHHHHLEKNNQLSEKTTIL